MAKGKFITFEGSEGCGKSTQIDLACAWLKEQGKTVYLVREPGGTEISEEIRGVLLSTRSDRVSPFCELLLYQAARAQLVEEVIMPKLSEGAWVICDRFYDSTTAYQGYGRGLDLETIDFLNDKASLGLVPDLTIFFDLDPEIGMQRALASKTGEKPGGDRIEEEKMEFHQRVYEGFRAIALKESRFRTIDVGDRSIEDIGRELREILADL